MKVLSIDPDSQLGPVLNRQVHSAGLDWSFFPARRMGEALALLECDREIGCCLIDERVAALDDYALLALLNRRFPLISPVLVALRPPATAVRTWLGLGVRGVVLREMQAQETLRALRVVVDGGLYLPPGICDATVIAPVFDRPRPALPALTPRQTEVLALLGEGLATRDICAALGLSEGTVKNHLAAIFRQLRVQNRLQAVLLVKRYGADTALRGPLFDGSKCPVAPPQPRENAG